METKEIKNLAEKRQTIRNFYFQTAGGKSANVKAARVARREIAQILTRLSAATKKIKS